MVMFNLMASDPSNVQFQNYQTFCGLLLFISCLVLFINHWSKYIGLMIICWAYPGLQLGVYLNV